MNFDHLDADAAIVERLKQELSEIEYEENRLKRELENWEAKRQDVLKKLSTFNDDRYEEDMLQKVYEQRRGGRR